MNPAQPRSKKRTVTGIQNDVLPYHSGRRQGPSPIQIDVMQVLQTVPGVSEYARVIDFGWLLCRQPLEDTLFNLSDDEQQAIPAWTAFNVSLIDVKIPRESCVGYCPVIEASPTELPTVYTVLQRSLDMADHLGQEDVIVVFDQAIYAKALEIQWQNEQRFQRLVVRMGTFHITCAYLAAIGKRFRDAGLSDVLIESGVVATGSVAGVLEGRHYNRALRIHKIVFEAMHRLLWQCFGDWLQLRGQGINYVNLVQAIRGVRKEYTVEKFNALSLLGDFLQVFDLYRQFCQEDTGPLKTFWMSYLDMVGLLMDFIRATREGNWSLHLHSIKEMMPWFFAYDHTNYARYLPVYLLHMVSLPETHPEAHRMLENGDFGVQRTSEHGFAQVPIDQTIEQTLNRSTKTKGGIVGFSLRKGAVQRWILTAHSRAAFVDKCRAMSTGVTKNQSRRHKEAASPRVQRDETDVKKVMDTVSNWRNPFESSDELVSISSGYVASESMAKDLLMAKEKGKSAAVKFIENRLVSSNTGFFDPLPKMKLGTFRDARKKTSVQMNTKTVIVRADRNLFARLLVIGQSRKLSLRELLSHELGPLPWSLASCDGSLAKTNKAVLPKLLEEGMDSPQNLPIGTTAFIIDAMAMLQMLVRVPDRFGDLAEVVLAGILRQAGNASRIDFVADQYPEISIKNTERHKRGRGGELVVNISSPEQLCPRQWKKFMANGRNKTNLMNFLVKEWSNNHRFAEMIGDRTVYVAHGAICTKIINENGAVSANTASELNSNQEEADTRMFLHCSHASNSGHRRIIIKSSDTDVEVLACYHQRSITAELTIISGTKNRSRLVSVSRMCDQLGEEICQVLPSLHALTGCDTVSTFVGKGKKKALGMLKESDVMRQKVRALGETVPPRQDNLNDLEHFVCALYGDTESLSVNQTRYSMFCKSQSIQSHQLPPTESALLYHLKRANYQTYIWKNALQATIPMQEPEGQGWKVTDGHLGIVWTDLPPAPNSVMELVCCGCKGTCATRRCSCLKNELPCTDACSCQEDCANSANDLCDEEDDDSGDSSGSSGEDD